MKKFGSILLTLAVLLTLCAGVLPVYAEDASISITSTKTVLMVGQTTYITVTAPSSATDVTIDIDNEDVLSYNDTNSTITGLKKGTAVITASCTDGSGNALTDSVTVKVRAPTGLINNTDYYIMNCDTGKLLSLKTVSDANNVNIVGRALSDKFSYSQWKVLIQSDGTTRLQSVYSTVGRALYTPGSRVILYNSTGARTKFDLHRVESGTNQGKYLIRYDNKYVSMDSTGQVYMSASLVAGSCWSFMAVEKGYADIYSHNYNYIDSNGSTKNFNTTANNTLFHNTLLAAGYLPVESINETAEYAYEYLPDDVIFVFRGHGTPAMIHFYGDNGRRNGIITVDEILPQYSTLYPINSMNANTLANLRCVLLLGCSTGVDFNYYGVPYNLLDAFFEQGAHFVLGTNQDTEVPDSNAFLKGFLNELSSDSSDLYDCVQAGIKEAGKNAKYVTTENPDGYYPTVCVGDSNQYLN